MTENKIMSVLWDFGLTEKESEVYIFLAKSGVLKAGEVSKRLRMHKAQVYRILEVLQRRGLLESTLEFPTRFIPIPFEKFLDLTIEAKKEETVHLEEKKDELLAYWRSIRVEQPAPPLAKFVVITGRNRVYSKILQLVKEAKREALAITDISGVMRSEQVGIVEVIKKRNLRFRILTNVSKKNHKIAKEILEKTLSNHLKIEGRHKDLVSEIYPRFVIKDREEAVFFLTPRVGSIASQADTGLWTNSEEIVSVLKIFFEELWRGAVDIRERLNEIETGRPPKETVLIREAGMAYRRFSEIVDAAEEEIIEVTTSKDLIGILENRPVQKWSEKGVRVRIMVPINLEHLEASEKLSEYLQIRYSDAVYIRMVIVDNRHLFMFKTPPTDEESVEPAAYFDHLLYTNEPEYVDKMKEMMEEIWNKSPSITDIKTGEAMRSPPMKFCATDPASKVIGGMLANNIGSVIVVQGERPVGIITEEDVLNRVVKNKRNPERTFAKDIMSAPVITVDRDENLLKALEIMKAKGIRRLAVTEKGILVGVLTERRALARSRVEFGLCS